MTTISGEEYKAAANKLSLTDKQRVDSLPVIRLLVTPRYMDRDGQSANHHQGPLRYDKISSYLEENSGELV